MRTRLFKVFDDSVRNSECNRFAQDLFQRVAYGIVSRRGKIAVQGG
jgi:hypothetical protein